MYFIYRNDDQWPGDSKNGPSESEQPTYDGPPGMDPDGIIESNWDVVSILLAILYYNILDNIVLLTCLIKEAIYYLLFKL